MGRVYEFDIKANVDAASAIKICNELDGVMARLKDKKLRIEVDSDTADLKRVKSIIDDIVDEPHKLDIFGDIAKQDEKIKKLRDELSELQDILKFKRNDNHLGVAAFIEKEMKEIEDAINDGIDPAKYEARMRRIIDLSEFAGMANDESIKKLVDSHFFGLRGYKPNAGIFKQLQYRETDLRRKKIPELENKRDLLYKKFNEPLPKGEKASQKKTDAEKEAADAAQKKAEAEKEAADAAERKQKAEEKSADASKEAAEENKKSAESASKEAKQEEKKSAEETARSTEKEGKKADEAATSFRNLKEAKEEFTRANKEASKSAEETADSAKEEGDAAKEASKKMGGGGGKKESDFDKASSRLDKRISIMKKKQNEFVKGMIDSAEGDNVLKATEDRVKALQNRYKAMHDANEAYAKKHPEDQKGINALKLKENEFVRDTNEKIIKGLENKARSVKKSLDGIIDNPEKYDKTIVGLAQDRLKGFEQMSNYVEGLKKKNGVLGLGEIKDALSYLKDARDVIDMSQKPSGKAKQIDETNKQADAYKELNNEIEKFNKNQENSAEKSLKGLDNGNAYDKISESIREANEEYDKLLQKHKDYQDEYGAATTVGDRDSTAKAISDARQRQFEAIKGQITKQADDLINNLIGEGVKGGHTSAYISEIEGVVDAVENMKSGITQMTADDFFNIPDIQSGIAKVFEDARSTMAKAKTEFKDSDMSKEYKDTLDSIKAFSKADTKRLATLMDARANGSLSSREAEELRELEGRYEAVTNAAEKFINTYKNEPAGSKMIETITKGLDNLNESLGENIANNSLKKMMDSYKELLGDMKKFNVKELTKDLFDSKGDISQKDWISSAISKFQALIQEAEEFKEVFADSMSPAMFKGIDDAIDNLQRRLADEGVNQLQKRLKAQEKDVKQLLGSENITPEYRKNLEDALDVINRAQENVKRFDLSKAFTEQSDDVQKALGAIVDGMDEIDERINKFNTDSAKLASNNSLHKWAEKFQNILSSYNLNGKLKSDVQDYLNEINGAFGEGNISNMSVERLKEINSAFYDIEASAKRGGMAAKGFWQQFSGAVTSQSAQFLARYFSFYDFIRYGRELVNTVTTIDSAMIELAKVSDASNTRLEQSFQTSAKTAQEMGSTVSDVINSTADWARLGYDVDEAERLARVTELYKTVGDNMTQESASQSLISTLKGFQMESSEAERIVDSINEVSNNFAIDTAGIGEALQRSAAAFNASGTDLNKSIALVTTANAVVQDPASVGTVFKTLSARIRGSKVELQELGEEEDDFTQSTSKLRDMVKGLTGFDIMKDEDTYKDIYEILRGIGKEWGNLTDIERAGLAEALGGKRAANALFAVLQNTDELERAYQTAQGAEGSAMREHERYAQSVQYSIDRTKASLQELSVNFLSSDLLKSLLEGANTLLGTVNGIVDAIGSPAAITGFMLLIDGLKGLMGAGGLTSTVGTALLTSKFGVEQGQTFAGTISNAVKKVFTSGEMAETGAEVGETIVDNAAETVSKSANKIIAFPQPVVEKSAKKIGKEVGEEITENAAEATASKAAAKSIGSTFARNIVPILGGAALAGLIGYSIYSAIKEQEKKQISNAKLIVSQWEEADTTLEGYAARVVSLRSELESDTTSDARQLELKQQIYSIQQEIVSSYGSQAEGINLVNGDLEKQLELIRNISSQNANNILVQNAADFALANKEATKEYAKTISGIYNADVADDVSAAIRNSGIKHIQSSQMFLQNGEIVNTLEIKGNAKEVSEDVEVLLSELNNLQSEYSYYGATDAEYQKKAEALGSAISSIALNTSDITSAYKSLKPMLDAESKALFNQADGSYKVYKNLKDAKETLDEALMSGDDGQIGKAIDNFKAQSNEYFKFAEKINNPAYDPRPYYDELTAGIDEATFSTIDFSHAMKTGYALLSDSKYKDNAKEIWEISDAIKSLSIDAADARALMNAEGLTGDLLKYQQGLNYLAQEYNGFTFGDVSADNMRLQESFINYLSEEDVFIKSVGEQVDSVGTKFKAFKTKAINAIAGIDTLNSAIVSSMGSKGITYSFDENGEITGDLGTIIEAYKDLEGYNPVDLFTKTATGIKLNTKTLRKLQAQQDAVMKQGFLDQQRELTDALTEALLANEAARRSGKEEPVSADQIAQLRNYIDEVNRLSGVYEGANSLYQKWLDSQNMPNPGDMYKAIRDTGIKNARELIKNGEYTSELRAMAELVSGEDLSEATPQQWVEKFKQIDQTIPGTSHTLQDFFQEGTKGVDAFMDSLVDLGFATEENGKYMVDALNSSAVADAFNTSTAFVDMIIDYMELKGAVINRMDEAQAEELATIQGRLQEQQDNMSEKGNTISDRLGLKDPSTLNTLEDITGEIKKIDDYMSSGASDRANADNLRQLQDYYDLLVQASKVFQTDSGTGLINEEAITETVDALETIRTRKHEIGQEELKTGVKIDLSDDAEIDKAVDTISKQAPEVKAKIGLDEDASKEDIYKAIEDGWDLSGAIDKLLSKDVAKSIGDLLSEQINGEDGEGVKVKFDADTEAIDSVLEQYTEVDGTIKYTAEFSDEFEERVEAGKQRRISADLSTEGGRAEANRERHTTVPERKPNVNALANEYYSSGGNPHTRRPYNSLFEFLEYLKKTEEDTNRSKFGAQKSGNTFEPTFELTPKENVDEINRATENSFNAFGGTVVRNNIKGIQKGIQTAVDTSNTSFEGSAQVIQSASEELSNPKAEHIAVKKTVDVETKGADVDIPDAVMHAKVIADDSDLKTEYEGELTLNVNTAGADVGSSLAAGVVDAKMPDAHQHVTRDYDEPETEVVSATQAVNRRIGYDPSGIIAPVSQTVNRTIGSDVSTSVAPATQMVYRHVVDSGYPYYEGTVKTGGAFASGSLGKQKKLDDIVNNPANQTKSSETALTGELGQELVVNGNRWWTVGDHGAEFANIPKGSVVFNAEQTKKLLNQGYISGRGRAYLSGTNVAYATGTGTSYGFEWQKGGYNYGSSSSASTASSVASSAASTAKSAASTAKSTGEAAKKANDFKETLDEIEILIDRVDRQIEHIERTAQGAYNTFTKRNSAINEELGVIAKQMDNAYAGYYKYLEKANSVGLSADWISKIQNGLVNIEDVGDEDTWKKIEEYRDWYEKALDLLDTIDDLYDTQADLDRQRFDNLKQQYEDIISEIEHASNVIQKFIDITEEQNHLVAANYYSEMISYENQQIAKLTNERKALNEELVNAISKGRIEMGSEEFNAMQQEIDDVTEALLDAEKQIAEFNNAIRQLEWDRFDMGIDWIDDVVSELQFLNELLDTGHAYDEKGQVTDEGTARFGTMAMDYDVQMKEAQKYGDEIRKINAALASDKNDLALIDRKRELVKAQQEAILSAKKEKEAMKDLVEEGINKQIDSLGKLIDEYTKLLDNDQSEIEYARRIAEQQKEIDQYRKQMMSWQGDTSEEGAARRQKTASELRNAEQDLAETQEDHRISEIKASLTELQDNFSEVLNARLDNIDMLLSYIIDGVNMNAASIQDTINTATFDVGTTVSDTLNNALSAASTALEKSISANSTANTQGLSKLSTDFKTLVSNFENGTFKNTNASILSAINKIFADIDVMAYDAKLAAQKRIDAENKRKADNLKKQQEADAAAAKKKADDAKKAAAAKSAPAPAPAPAPAKTSKPVLTDDIKRHVAAAVWNGYMGWSDGNTRVKRLTEVFGENNGIQALVNAGVGATGIDPKGYDYETMRKKFRGYATGIKKLDRDQWAITQEKGMEAIMHNGELLTPLSAGDSVFNKLATENLWNFANNPRDFMKDINVGMPDIKPFVMASGGNNVDITFNLPNVTDSVAFMRELQSNRQFQNLIQEMTLGQLNGHGKLAKNSIRFS